MKGQNINNKNEHTIMYGICNVHSYCIYEVPEQ